MATTTRTERRTAPTFDQFYAVRRFQPTLAFTPDGRHILFSCDISGQHNLWRVPVEGGWPEQLTVFEEQSVRNVSVSPDGGTIVFTADRHGDEFHQIYALPAGGGRPEPWTDAPQVQHFINDRCWSPDGRRIAYSANAEKPTDMDVWIRDVASGEVRKAAGLESYAMPASWSPDGSKLLVWDARTTADMSLYLADVGSGEGRELTPHEGEVKFLPGPWAPDGSGFYLLTDEGREYLGIGFYRLDEGRYVWIEAAEDDVDEIAGSADGSVLAWIVNEDGWGRLVVRDRPAPRLPRGTNWFGLSALTLSADGSHAALIWSGPQSTFELYVVETATGEARRISHSMLGGLTEDDLVAPDPVSYPTFDGRDVAAWLYRPHEGNGRLPVVVSFHGGPDAQERPWYQPFYQYLVGRGIAVLAPNIRGSTGYGKSYQKLIHHDWGGGDLRDMEHAAKWLREQGWVDPGRIGVFGGSYGGFATLSCVTRLPEYWAAAVDIVGPSNLVTFIKAVPPSWRRFTDRWVGNPETEADFLMERSPITYVDGVRAPLLVMQGANDPRVVKGESDQMVERLRELGRDVEYVVFDDEGHGFTKRANQLRAYRLAADWFEKHLL